jgi:hypothetical protein
MRAKNSRKLAPRKFMGDSRCRCRCIIANLLHVGKDKRKGKPHEQSPHNWKCPAAEHDLRGHSVERGH